MSVRKNKVIKLLILTIIFLFSCQGTLAEVQTSQVTITHVDADAFSDVQKAQISSGLPFVVGDGRNYQYALVYKKAALHTAMVTPTQTAATYRSNTVEVIPNTGDEQADSYIYVAAMLLSAVILTILLIKGKKWAKMMIAVVLLLGMGVAFGQSTLAQIKLPENIEKQVALGEEYRYTPPVVEGHTYIGYILTILAPQIGRVIVSYENTFGETVDQEDIMTGAVGTSYQSEAKSIAGYQLKETPANAQGIYTAGDIEVAYIYEALGKAIVRYMDESQVELLPAHEQIGVVGTSYSFQEEDIANYNYIRNDGAPKTGQYTVADQFVDFIYKKKMGTITVKYIDEEGSTIKATDIINDYVGEICEILPPIISNHTLLSSPEVRHIAVVEGNTDVILEYELRTGTVIIKYVDVDTSLDIESPIIFVEKIGKTYTSQALNIQNYVLKSVPENGSGEFTDGMIEVIYTYEKKLGRIIVRYMDEDGNTRLPDKVIDGYWGDSYSEIHQTITGYAYQQAEGMASGTISQDSYTVTFRYKKITHGFVDVIYAFWNGTVLQSETLTGLIGENYTTLQRDISGYVHLQTVGNPSGQFGYTLQVVKYVYRPE